MSRTVVVTGGGTGIGFAIAAAFAAAGDDVIITGRRTDVLNEAAAKLGDNVVPFVCDATNVSHVSKMPEYLPGSQVDVLVNNAGGVQGFQYPETGDLRALAEHWKADLNANLMTAVLTTHALEKLIPSGGSVIHIGSFATDRAQGSYGAAKAALHSWSLYLARVWGPRGITSNVVAPGYIADTEFFGPQPPPGFHESRIGETFLGRAGHPDDIAGAVSFLASPAARHITGTVLHVNGGALTTR